jgi:dihydrofolate reductase
VTVAIVVAHAANRAIGRDGGLLWHLPGDMARFREVTAGRAVIMGRRTWESIPERFRPLPGRRNIVLTSDPAYAAAGAETAPDLHAALALAGDDACVIGGERVYAEALHVADRAYVTRVEAELDGDAFFPELPEGWSLTQRDEPRTEDGLPYVFETYERAG